MKRKDFLRNTISGVILPSFFNGIPLKSFAENSPLARLLGGSADNDHVLVIVQLQGGNDGLNMVIPLDNYSNYYNARSNVAIDESQVLPLQGNTHTGLHPALTGLKAMYDDGKLGIVQAVGYPQPNFSHFRATDIWMSGAASDQVLLSGWGGRYLDYEFPNFPNGYPNSSMPDPLGIQIGSVTSLVFQGPSTSMGMSISNPTSFYNLLNGVQDTAPNTLAGKELQFIREVAKQTTAYATVVKNAALKVTQQSTYPSANPLGDQLKIVARLIKGGLKTKVYMVSYGSFDTHSLQTDSANHSIGRHADLLKIIGDAIKAFQDDLKYLNIEDRVMGITFSEFGRRIKSNSSAGTDHGAAAPLFIFGSNAIRMVHGNNPDIPVSATVNDNIPMQYDFRSVYASMLQDWLCVKQEDLQQIMLNNFQNIPLVNTSACNTSIPNTSGKSLISNYPNPFNLNTNITFTTAGGHTLIQILNTLGQLVATPLDKVIPVAGTYNISWSSYKLSTGVYYARLQNGSIQQVKSMLKVQ
jgi:uncharacterized protein (DUF1501 family)